MLSFVISVFLFIIPLYVWRGWDDGVRAPKEFLSIVGFLAVIIVSLYHYRLKPFKNKWLLFFLGWCFLTTFLSNYNIPIYLDKIVLTMPSIFFAWKELFYITIAILTIYCISSAETVKPLQFKLNSIEFSESELSVKMICNTTAITLIILSVYSIIQAIGLDEWFRVWASSTNWQAPHPLSAGDTGSFSHRIVGTMGNPSLFAIWISVCLPLCLYLRSKLGYLAFILGIITLCLTKSAMAIFGAVIGIFIYFLFINRKIFLALSIIGIIGLALGIRFDLDHKLMTFINPMGRIEVHKEAFNVLKDKAITGLGLGTFEPLIGNNPEVVKKLGNQNWRELHDDIGQIWFTTGLIGLTLFSLFVFTSMLRFFWNITPASAALFASLSAFLVISLGHFTMRISPMSFYGAILTGVWLGIINEK